MKQNTLVRNNDFVRAYSKGKSYVHPLLVIYVNKNRFGHTRIGITSGKKIGNAVVRNRARRVIREAIREVMPNGIGAVDIVLVARGSTAKSKSWQISRALDCLLKKSGHIVNA